MADLHPHINSPESSKGMITSLLVHLLLLLFILTPYFKKTIIEEPVAGIIVSFGDLSITDEKAGGDTAESSIQQQDGSEDVTTEDSKETPSVASTSDQAKATPSPEKSKAPPSPDPTKPATKQDTPVNDDVARAAQAAKEKAAADAESRKKREEALAQKKAQFGDLLAGGTGQSSSQSGILEGDPDTDALAELTAGSGSLGGGLVNRGLVYEPKIEESSQQTGRVVIDICVDSQGKVTEARYTQKGSTTTASLLVAAAQKAALKYQFTPSEVDRQCGSLKIEFRVQ